MFLGCVFVLDLCVTKPTSYIGPGECVPNDADQRLANAGVHAQSLALLWLQQRGRY